MIRLTIVYLQCVLLISSQLVYLPLIYRELWNARSQLREGNCFVNRPIQRIVIHSSKTKQCYSVWECSKLVRTIQDYHMDDKHCGDISFNFLIGSDGNIYEGCGWYERGAFVEDDNEHISICLIGDTKYDIPLPIVATALQNLLNFGKTIGYLDNLYTIKVQSYVSNKTDPSIHA